MPYAFNLHIFEMYNNGRVAAICYNSFRQISNTDAYLAYETIAVRKKNEKSGHYQAIVKGPPCPKKNTWTKSTCTTGQQ